MTASFKASSRLIFSAYKSQLTNEGRSMTPSDNKPTYNHANSTESKCSVAPMDNGDTLTRAEGLPGAVSPCAARCAWPPSSWAWHRAQGRTLASRPALTSSSAPSTNKLKPLQKDREPSNGTGLAPWCGNSVRGMLRGLTRAPLD